MKSAPKFKVISSSAGDPYNQEVTPLTFYME